MPRKPRSNPRTPDPVFGNYREYHAVDPEHLKVYVAGSDTFAASHVAHECHELGWTVVSTWHYGIPFTSMPKRSDTEKANNAVLCVEEISKCDLLILISNFELGPGGKFIEAGIAYGMGKAIIVIGRRENTLLYHPDIPCIQGTNDLFIQAQRMFDFFPTAQNDGEGS